MSFTSCIYNLCPDHFLTHSVLVYAPPLVLRSACKRWLYIGSFANCAYDGCRYVLADATQHSLVLVDELGKGTEVNAGAALAGAILEALDEVGCKVGRYPLGFIRNTQPSLSAGHPLAA